MKIIVALATGANNTEQNVLRAFYAGVERHYFEKFGTRSARDIAKHKRVKFRLEYTANYESCDLAVQFGAAKDRQSEHHVAKQQLEKVARHVVCIDTPLLGRVINDQHRYPYYRIGLDGFQNNQGILYRNDNIDQSRLDHMRRIIDVPVFPGWRDHTRGDILILPQLPGDASLRGAKVHEWLLDTIDLVRQQTNRPIQVRLHPAMSSRGREEFLQCLGPILLKNHAKLTWHDGRTMSLSDQLKGVGVCVTYNSGSAIDCILHGVPTVTTDQGSLAWPVSWHWIDDLESIEMPDEGQVNQWLHTMANCQWNLAEMRSGRAWQHVLDLLEEIAEPRDDDAKDSSDLS